METKIKELDRSNLRQVILDSAQHLLKGAELGENVKATGNFSRLVISGMGGSALPGELLKMYAFQIPDNSLEIYLNRTYSLPKQSFENSLNFFASYSGNTEETLSALTEALEKKLPSIVFTTGGALEKMAKENNLPCVLLPKGLEPRCATGYFFASMLKVLSNSGLFTDETKLFPAIAENLEKDSQKLEEEGKQIAQKIKNQTPIIYASDYFRPLAMIWKIAINENSKTPAFYNIYPELNHNEMVGYTLPQGQFHILTLTSSHDHAQIQKRMHITAELLKEKGLETTSAVIPEGHIFFKIFYTLILGEWVSYYLALEYGQDPTPVLMVEKLKGLLK